MKRNWTLLAATTIGLGAGVMIGCERNDTTRTSSANPPAVATNPPGDVDRTTNDINRTNPPQPSPAERTGEMARDTGENLKDAARTASDKIAGVIPTSEREAYSTVSQITSAAMTKGGFDDLVERLAKSDRDRLHDYANGKNFDDLDAKVAELQADWQAKYQHDFSINSVKPEVFKNFVSFTEVKKEGYNTGTITLPASHDMPDLTFALESTGTSWKIDLPDTITGEQLKMNLMKQLDALHASKDSWPADMDEAYRLFSHHVMMALAGK